MSEYSIQRTEDTDVIDWLQSKCLPEDTPYKHSGAFWWVARFGSEPVGFGGHHVSDAWSSASFLCRSGVRQAHRGNGLQKRLIWARVNHARRLGLEWSHTYTKSNPASSNSLIHCGFRIYTPSYEWGPREAIYFRKKLQ